MTASPPPAAAPALSHWQRPSLRLASELHWRERRTRAAILRGGVAENLPGRGSSFARLARRRRRGSEDSDDLALPAATAAASASAAPQAAAASRAAEGDESDSSGSDDVDAVALHAEVAPTRPGAELREVMESPAERRAWRRACRAMWRVAAGACTAAGLARLGVGDASGASAAFRQALLVDGGCAAVWALRGKAFAAMGALPAAELHFDRALQLEGGEAEHVGAALPVPAECSAGVAGPDAGAGGLPWDLGSVGAERLSADASRRDVEDAGPLEPLPGLPVAVSPTAVVADSATAENSPAENSSAENSSAGNSSAGNSSANLVAGLDLLLADVLAARSCTACKVLCMRALALSAGQSDAEAVAADLRRAICKAAARLSAGHVPLPSVRSNDSTETTGADLHAGSGAAASASSLPAGWASVARALAREAVSGTPETPSRVLAAAAFLAHDEGRELFEETFVRSAARKFMAALVLAAASHEGDAVDAAASAGAGVGLLAVPEEELVAMWLNLSAALLRRASGGGTGASSRLCRRALAAAAVALDCLCAAVSVVAGQFEQEGNSSSAAAEADESLLELPGLWLPGIVGSTMPRRKAASGSSLRDPAEQTRAATVGRALAKAVAGRGAEGHRLAVKALYRAGQALAEAGALRQGAACLRGGLVMCSLWLRLRSGASRAEFDAMASARRLRRELRRVRQLATAIGAFE